jgi:hypothetical protein
MIRSWGASTLVATALVAALAGRAHANLLWVDDDHADPFQCASAPYSTIAAALAAAQPGDEVRVCPGTYREQVVVTMPIRLTGVSFGTARPIVRPPALLASRPSMLGAQAVTAGILIDDGFARLTNIDVDLADANVTTCSPLLAGVYLRNTSGKIDGVNVSNVRVAGQPLCDSGVGVYLESGQTGEVLGHPVFEVARVYMRNVTVQGFQKAGVVANGPKTIVVLKGGGVAGDGPSALAVQNGYQFGYGTKAKVSDVTIRDIRSLVPAKAAACVLVYQTTRVMLHALDVTGCQEGVLSIGDRTRVRKGSFVNSAADAIAFFGNANLAAGNFIDVASVSGVFVSGNTNSIRGGVMRDLDRGFWFATGNGNTWSGIQFQNVPVTGQGPFGGVRDLDPTWAAPFTTN